MGSQASSMPSIGSSAVAAPAVATTLQSDDSSTKPKPCCVCKDEKSKRDECMLFSTAADPEKDCNSTIEQYRSCMAGFGFKV
ncbi:cytochrome C oxidase copper chaperone-domain-containing protein [Phialemonium atrogriseum]|uniref:Cytochrome C oxidase copper chaperone-domain-containing protein n=1 Tax=Phialemonium atrogriseum TaxID=1093897 RepID=A0AAJ0C1I5_9PEZI|nr:cytochrome C oxidase copper chaperone-domain-containing protein [Phialemonium atrogriseum]KAK1768425.1 cytochrome C oxidase copper chaperone-domain-containing protein [Phialemonium atrogriseum]